MWYKMATGLFRFVTNHAFDGQTDGRTAFSWLYRASHYMKSHGKSVTTIASVLCSFISERELTFAFAIMSSSVCRLSVCLCPSVCRRSVTFVHPYSGHWNFRNVSTPLDTSAIRDIQVKFDGDCHRGTPTSAMLNARWVAEYSDFRPIEGYLGNGAG